MRNAIIAAVVVVLIGAAFWGGTIYANAGDSSSDTATFGPRDGTGFAGGSMADLTDEERAELANMTDEERQTFFEQKFGADAANMPGEGMRGPRGGIVEGEVLEVAADAITVKLADDSSQTIYLDEDTVIGYAKGVGDLAAGSQVLVIAQPEADGVTTAQAIVITE